MNKFLVVWFRRIDFNRVRTKSFNLLGITKILNDWDIDVEKDYHPHPAS